MKIKLKENLVKYVMIGVAILLIASGIMIYNIASSRQSHAQLHKMSGYSLSDGIKLGEGDTISFIKFGTGTWDTTDIEYALSITDLEYDCYASITYFAAGSTAITGLVQIYADTANDSLFFRCQVGDTAALKGVKFRYMVMW